MIVYIYNGPFFNKIILPIKVNGVYPIFSNDQKFLANIEEIDNKWTIKKNDEIILLENDEETNIIELKNYQTYTIKSILYNFEYYLYCSPIYDANLYRLFTNKTTITIGNSELTDIYFKNPKIANEIITLTFTNNYWTLNTESQNIYINDYQKKQHTFLFGDYLFYYGLKIIIIGKIFIISNPNGTVNINKNSFTLLPEEQAPNNIHPAILNDLPLYSKDDYFLKSSRFTSIVKEEIVKIDEPPAPIKPNDMPIILTIGPQLTMVCTSAITLFSYVTNYLEGTASTIRFVISLSTIVITITGALLWPTLTRRFNNKKAIKEEAKRQEKYHNYLIEKLKKIRLIKNEQRQIMLENNVTLDNCKLIIENRSRNLWERNIEHPDFLQIRLGKGTIESKIKVEEPTENFSIEDKDHLKSELEQVVNEAKYLEDAPLCLSLTQNYITAIVGPDDLSYKFLGNIFLQIMALHSYSELKIVVFTSPDNEHIWNYLKILPHNWNNARTIRYFATNSEEMNIISTELDKIFENRLNSSIEEIKMDDGTEENKEDLYKKFRPYYLIFVDDINAARKLPIIKRILNYKKNMGFRLQLLLILALQCLV